jgi:hypothetical protein
MVLGMSMAGRVSVSSGNEIELSSCEEMMSAPIEFSPV